jgi:hypothetical protein
MVLSFVHMLEVSFFVGLRRSAPISECHLELHMALKVMNLNKTNLYLHCSIDEINYQTLTW